MSENDNKMYLVFESTRNTILTERECKAKGYMCVAVPVPREYSSKCGIALDIPEEGRSEILEFIGSSGRSFRIFDKDSPKIDKVDKGCSVKNIK